MPALHILIIGGGANGVAAFIHLISEFIIAGKGSDIRLTIVEREGEIGTGLAFGTKQPGHLLNTQSRFMGIHPWEPTHYTKWLEANKHLVSDEELKQFEDPEESYTTRRLYSSYLKSCFSEYLRVAQRHRVQVNCVTGEALDIRNHSKGYEVSVDGRGWLFCDIVVLSPGTPKPRNYEHLEKFKNYIDFPWPSQPLLEIPSAVTVAILGTSLSAIDAVMTLVDNNHKGDIILTSPDGVLPRVQPGQQDDYICRVLTPENIHALRRKRLRALTAADLFRLFREEVREYYGHKVEWGQLERRGRSARSLLEEDIRIAERGGDGPLNVAYATRDFSSAVWQWLPADEKLKFKRWFGIDWTSTRHAMPLHNARRIRHLFDEGRLFVYDRLREVRYEHEQFFLKHGSAIPEAGYIINATGPGVNLNEMKSTLVSNLHQSGFLESYDAGGIRINTETMQVLSSRHDTTGIYAIGHLANGMLLDSNAVWFNIKAIAAMTRHILIRCSDR